MAGIVGIVANDIAPGVVHGAGYGTCLGLAYVGCFIGVLVTLASVPAAMADLASRY
jgi:hypothetical protein